MVGALIAPVAAIGSTSFRRSQDWLQFRADDLGIGTLNSVWKQAGIKK
jgi:hypothetical protein